MVLATRYVRAPRPLSFPSTDPEWEMSQGLRHHRLCELLYLILKNAVGDGSSVGCDQFVYFDPTSPARKCAPDGFVKLGVPQALFDSWKTWEAGVPELCLEILSSDAEEKLSLAEKLARFHAMGVREVVVFHADAPEGSRLRAWDLVSGDLVERVVEGDVTPCRTLGLRFVVTEGEPLDAGPVALRLEGDSGLVLTNEERARRQAERERKAKERERKAKERERAEKELALRELERLRAALASEGRRGRE